MACEYGSEKKPNSPLLFAIDDNPLCFLFGLGGLLCKLGKILVAVAEGKKPIKVFIRNRIKEILADAFNGEFVVTSSFCSTMPPPIPSEITPSDIAAWLLSLADPSGLIPSGELPDKITALWRIQKWQEYCQCKAGTPYVPPIDPILPDPDEPIPPEPSPNPATCEEITASENANQRRGAWNDMQIQLQGKADADAYAALYCGNQPLAEESIPPAPYTRIYRYIQFTVFQYNNALTGIDIATCITNSKGYIVSFAVFVCNDLLNPPDPTDYPYFATPNEPEFDLEQFCIDTPDHPVCSSSDKCCKCPPYFWSANHGLWLS